MLGSIAGDIIGSPYEFKKGWKSKEFELFNEKSYQDDEDGQVIKKSRFTDDTVHTVALMDSILTKEPYVLKLKEYFHRYPNVGYGRFFKQWAEDENNLEPYNSYGNGSAMRVSPIACIFGDIQLVLDNSKMSAEITHNHPEGIAGAQIIASAIFLLRKGFRKGEVKKTLMNMFGLDILNKRWEEIQPEYSFDATCQGSVPHALISFFEGRNFEDCIRNAIALGGDADTLACMAGGLAEAHYGLPEEIGKKAFTYLDDELKEVVSEFYVKYKL
jgi:ADP-ribosylglycohydrolase